MVKCTNKAIFECPKPYKMKSELILRLEELLQKDALEVAHEVRALQKEYQKTWAAEFESARQAFISDGGSSKEFHYAKSSEDTHFDSLLEQYAKAKKDAETKLAAAQARNLTIRLEIIAKIKDLSHVSENVGAAVRKLQELQAQWKETGQVSPHKYKEVQSEYSHAVEEFYYNLKIFRDLQEHDLKKNLELKSQLIEKLRGLQQHENIKEAERLIKIYRNEWDEIGPVPNARWENLKQEYKTALDEVYGRIKAHYNSVEEQKENNLQKKQNIIQRTRELVESMTDPKPQKWMDATEKLLAMQAEWKNTGRTYEKDNDKVWHEFRSVCDTFFERKKEFFSGLNEKFSANRKIKTELIAKAEAMQDSTDWHKTTGDLIRLQEQWKKHPSQGDKEEPRLYARFRKACNVFFDNKKKHHEALDASFEKNLAIKEDIVKKLNEFELSEDMADNRERLKAFTSEWNSAGHVPGRERKRINDAFYNRLDELYEKMHFDKHERAALQFRTKLERLSAAENGEDLLLRENDHLRRQSDEVSARLRTYDNNRGFFKPAKGENSFIKEIEQKIQAEKDRLDEISEKRKLIKEAIARLRERENAKAEA